MNFELDLDLGSALAIPRRCPGCSSSGLRPVARGGVVTFRCRRCESSWAFQLGTWTLVSPSTPEPAVTETGSSPTNQRPGVPPPRTDPA